MPQTMAEVKQELRRQWIETPSWAYGNTGTRFKVFRNPAAARDPYEKVERRRLRAPPDRAWPPRWRCTSPGTGSTTTPGWPSTRPTPGCASAPSTPTCSRRTTTAWAASVTPTPGSGARPPTTCSSASRWRPRWARRRVSLWFADGTNYPGQDDTRARQDRLAAALQETYAALPEGMGMLLEYKLFEPGFYTMDVPDWGTSLAHCLALGPKANVLVDTGHHAPGTNIEFIVASLLRLGRLGGFHFNSRFYADDDLLVGAADPYQLFRVLSEVVAVGAHRPGSGVAFMLDQCHNIEDKVKAEVRSVMNVQEATAKALLVDREALAAAQDAGDVLGRPWGAQRRLQHRRAPPPGRAAPGHGPGPRPAGGLRPLWLRRAGAPSEPGAPPSGGGAEASTWHSRNRGVGGPGSHKRPGPLSRGGRNHASGRHRPGLGRERRTAGAPGIRRTSNCLRHLRQGKTGQPAVQAQGHGRLPSRLAVGERRGWL